MILKVNFSGMNNTIIEMKSVSKLPSNVQTHFTAN